MSRQHSIRAWLVIFAGLGVNLILGVLYAWGVISAALIDQLDWSATQTQIPYMVACALFALCMVPGGRLQDRLGPRPVIMASAVLAAIGFIFSGVFLTLVGLTLFFGVVFGPLLGGLARDFTGCYTLAYRVSALLSALGCVLTLFVRPPRVEPAPQLPSPPLEPQSDLSV